MKERHKPTRRERAAITSRLSCGGRKIRMFRGCLPHPDPGEWPAGLSPEHWERAVTGLERLRAEIEALDHRLITVRVLPAVEAACGEADKYRAACRQERSSA